MKTEGTLVILATNCMLDNYSEKDIDGLLEGLEDEDRHLSNSIFIENYKLFDCRNSQSKINRLFCHKVSKALEEGAKIFIVVPDANMVDKRLRRQAVILSLPKKEEEKV